MKSKNTMIKARILNGLMMLSEKDKRICDIINNCNDYPEKILNMLFRNIETVEYVLNYKEKKNKTYSENVGKVKKREIPLLLQWDQRWGYGKYGNGTVATNGCGCTALSMVIVGLTENNRITPYVVAKYAEEKGYHSNDGTSWKLMTEGCKYFNVLGTEISLSKDSIYNNLKKGNPIICSMKPGDFTTIGHFIVLTGIEDEKIKVNDPNSINRSNTLWDYETLEYQIKNLWAFEMI